MNQLIDVLNVFQKYNLEFLVFSLSILGFILIAPVYREQFEKLEKNCKNHKKKDWSKYITDNEETYSIPKINTQYAKILNRMIKQKQYEQVKTIVNQMKHPNTIIYSILIRALAGQKNFKKVQEIIHQMENSKDFKPSLITYNTYLQCAFDTDNYETAQKIFKSMNNKDRCTYSIYTLNILKKGHCLLALECFEEMKKYQIIPDEVYYNILINGLMKIKQYTRAYQIWKYLENQDYKLNDFTVCVIIQLYSNLGMIDEARQIFEKSNNKSIYVYSCLIKMYTKTKSFDQVSQILNKLPKKDQVIYSQVITAFLQNDDQMKKGYDTIIESINYKIKIRIQIYQVAILSLFQIINKSLFVKDINVDEAKNYLNQIVNYTMTHKILMKLNLLRKISLYYYQQTRQDNVTFEDYVFNQDQIPTQKIM